MNLCKQELDCEVWKIIPGETKKYVSNMGRVKYIGSTKVRFIKPYFKHKIAPYFVKVRGKEVKLAKLVWITFYGTYDSKNYSIFHKFLNTDDRLINLEIVSKKRLGKITGGRARRRGIYQIDKNTNEIIKYYESSREAAKDNFTNYQTILDSCNNKSKKNVTGFKYVWTDKISI